MEKDGQIWMVKECPEHGKIEDIMAIDSKFLEHIENNYPGRDIDAHNDATYTIMEPVPLNMEEVQF